MALNPNHTFEDLGDIKCSIIEKNCSPERVDFLQNLLKINGKEVVIVPSPPPKTAAKPAEEGVEAPPAPETFTVGVTDLTFSPTNAIFNRELRTPDGKIVTPGYWYQNDVATAKEEKWYWKN